MVKKAKEMFTFGYDSYMKFAFPMDELDPIHCKGKKIELFVPHKWKKVKIEQVTVLEIMLSILL